MTTATGSAEEHPFIAAMERETPVPEWREVTVTLDNAGKKAWRLDGMLQRILEIAGQTFGRMRSQADRGPVDYAESDFERGMRAGARLPGNNYGGTTSNGNGSRLLGWLMTLNIAATLALGGWILKTLSENTRDIAVIQCRLSPECVNVAVRPGQQ